MQQLNKLFFTLVLLSLSFTANCRKGILQDRQLTVDPVQFEKTEFDIALQSPFINPYDGREIALDMIITSPAGHPLTLPCYYVSAAGEASLWQARFTPQESGQYAYHFQLYKKNKPVHRTVAKTFRALPSSKNGFLHTNDFWTLKFDSGKPFRAIGENVGWEARDFEDPKYTYDYLLPTLSGNGANFFRCWMCPWNLALEWKNVNNTTRYTDSDQYFNPSGIKRMDEFIQLAESLGLYIMLALDSHNALITDNQWEINNYNVINGGPAARPEEFFTLEESKARYKNRLRYLVARWGYSPSIAAWEFFNEIDNAVFTSSPENKERISPASVTRWHDEMSRYLKSIDPYQHIVTTSVSHRDIAGMNDLPAMDLNQKHIYKNTKRIRPEIIANARAHNKPYCIGEFAYEWDWNLDFSTIAGELDYDYKRGLWYGLFSPTPILPMTWWWEFFDERKMTPYFNSVRDICDDMLAAGDGAFDSVSVSARGLESLAVKCGGTVYAYLLNDSPVQVKAEVVFSEITDPGDSYTVEAYAPMERAYRKLPAANIKEKKLTVSEVQVNPRNEVILIVAPE